MKNAENHRKFEQKKKKESISIIQCAIKASGWVEANGEVIKQMIK